METAEETLKRVKKLVANKHGSKEWSRIVANEWQKFHLDEVAFLYYEERKKIECDHIFGDYLTSSFRTCKKCEYKIGDNLK